MKKLDETTMQTISDLAEHLQPSTVDPEAHAVVAKSIERIVLVAIYETLRNIGELVPELQLVDRVTAHMEAEGQEPTPD